DTSIVAGELGGQLIVTRLILASQGLIECTLQLPAGQKLFGVKLNNRPALLRPLGTSKWQLALGAPELPQSIEIVSRSDSDGPNRSEIQLHRPSLLAAGQPIPVEVSLW